MSDDLRTLLTRAADAEARRFEAEHRGEETSLYDRAITPRRRVRRLAEVGGAMAMAGAVALAAYALAHAPATLEPALPSPSVAPEATELTVPGGSFERDVDAATLVEAGGSVLGEVAECAELDTLARLDALVELGGEPIHVGAFLDAEGGVNGVHARTFSSESDAAGYLRAFAAAARACSDDAGVDVVVSDLGLVAVAGEGVRVRVTTGAGVDQWSAWVHTRADQALAVVVEPGATDLAGPILLAWFAGDA